MKRRLLVLALLCSCGPLAVEVTEPLKTVDGGSWPAPVSDAGQVTAVADAGPVVEPLTGLPCDVRAVLETHCSSCHAGQFYIPHLASRADFLLERASTHELIGQYALKRMQPGALSPMPPYGSRTTPSAADVAVIAGWVNAGMPGGACGVAVAR